MGEPSFGEFMVAVTQAAAEEKYDIYCPVCRTQLVVNRRARAETTTEHVCDPNAQPTEKDMYGCPNPDCVANEYELEWIFDGSYFGPRDYERIFIRDDAGEIIDSIKFSFIDGNNGAFNSYERQAVAERRKDEKWFKLGPIAIKLGWKYKSNYDGDVLSRKPKLRLLRKHRAGYVYYTPGFIWLVKGIKGFHQALKRYRETGDTDGFFGTDRLTRYFERPKWEKRWWRRVGFWYTSTFYGRVYREIKSGVG